MVLRDPTREQVVILDGPAPVLDVVYETIDAHVQRTGEQYEQVITGVGAEDVGDVDHETEAVLHVYVHASEAPEEALMWGERALDHIADDNDMDPVDCYTKSGSLIPSDEVHS